MIKLALADDQVLFRRGLSMLLRDMPEVQVVFECGNGEELLLGLHGNAVDIVLLDLEMPVMDGKEAMRRIKKEFPGLKVIVLSSHDEEEFIAPMVELGAHGYMLKTAEPNEIENAIGSVSENGFYFSEAVNRVMLQGLVSKQNVKPTFPEIDPLSEREIEVIRGICQEMTTTEIAGSLFISPRTVEFHRNNILLKTGARNVAGLVVYALTKGIYSPE
jgi:DNA-binding NarL/FixJ family response regulator